MKFPICLALILAFIAAPALADTYTNVPHPTALSDSNTGQAVALGIPGQGQSGLTYFANPSAANNFTGTFQINGVTQTFPASGLLVGTTDTQTLSAKTLTSPILTGVAVTSGGVAIGTSTASTVPLTIVGLGTTSPGTGGGYVCVDSAGQTYTKSTCP